MLEQFKAALAEKNRTRLALLLDEIDPDETDDAGNTALHLAAEQADGDMIRELLIRGCDPFAVNHYGWTALHSLVPGSYTHLFRGAALGKGVYPGNRSHALVYAGVYSRKTAVNPALRCV